MNAIIAVVCFIGALTVGISTYFALHNVMGLTFPLDAVLGALAAIIGSRITYIIVFSWWIGDNG